MNNVIPMDKVKQDHIRLLIVDDHDVVREGLRTVFTRADDIELAGEANSGQMAITLAENLNPDVILLDLKMPGMDGFATARSILKKHPNIKIIMLTGYESDLYAAEATDIGIKGFMGKNTPRSLLLNSIRVVHVGGTVFNYTDVLQTERAEGPSMRSISGTSSSPGVVLKPREKELLPLLIQGLTNKEIAQHLGLAEITVKKINSQLFRKLNASNRTQVALAAKQLGIN